MYVMQDIKIGQKSRIRIWISNQQFHGLRAPDDAFFHWNFWAWPDKLGRYILGHFRQIYQHPFGTGSPLSKVFINQPLFLQKNEPIYPDPNYLFGIEIWIWA